MNCIEISKFGGPEVLVMAERETPIPKPGQVLIKVQAAGVNRPDVIQRMGHYPAPPGDSDIPGLEVAGDIEALGEDVTGLAVGDRVCALIGGGGYATHAVAPSETVLAIPAGMDYVTAAGIPETFFTVWSNVFDRAYLRPSEWLLVHGGSSGIGSTAIQLAKAFGAKVITTAGSRDKVDFCKGLGADHAINYRSEDFVAATMAATDGVGVNVVLDMVGGDYIERNISCMAPDGRHVSIAFLGGPSATLNFLPVMLKRLTLTGSTLRARDIAFKGAVAKAVQASVWPLLTSGQIKPVIYETFDLADASKAHQLMETSGHMGKLILRC